MQPFVETGDTVTDQECAALVLDVVPLVMRTIRREMRAHRPTGMSVPQFRALIFLKNHAGASLSALAEHLGLTLSTTSRVVDGLVKHTWVTRDMAEDDRRRNMLRLTPAGMEILDAAQRQVEMRVMEQLAALTPAQRAAVAAMLRLLHGVFQPSCAPATGDTCGNN